MNSHSLQKQNQDIRLNIHYLSKPAVSCITYSDGRKASLSSNHKIFGTYKTWSTIYFLGRLIFWMHFCVSTTSIVKHYSEWLSSSLYTRSCHSACFSKSISVLQEESDASYCLLKVSPFFKGRMYCTSNLKWTSVLTNMLQSEDFNF